MRMQDRDLVAAIIAGDPAGLAAIYDRYAQALYAYCRTMLRDPEDAADALQDTFVVAAQKLDGLRDPDRLRPWLYAVARNECLRRVRSRQAQAMVDLDQAGEVSDDAVDVDAGMREADVRSLIWAAIQGLNPSEREVFELNVRHELEGADLAAALGVPPNHAHALLSRARGQLEKSLGALLVARTGQRDCPELATILTGWDGELTALLRKRINRHIEQCDICGQRKHRELRPEALLGALPILLLPPGMRSSVLRLVGNVMPTGAPPSGSSSGPSSSNGQPTTSNSTHNAPNRNKNAYSANANVAAIATANAAEYCVRVAKRAEPFDRAGFPVPVDRRRFRPIAAARRRSLVAAAILLFLLLGAGGYTAIRLISPEGAAAALSTPSPTVTAVVVDTQSSIQIQISTSSPSASPSKSPSQSASPSASASLSLSPSPSIVIITTPPPSPSRSPSRSPSPSPSQSPPPPPQGVLVAVPITATATSDGKGMYTGTFRLNARGGPVAGYTIVVPPPPPSNLPPTAAPTAGGQIVPNEPVTITVTINFSPVVFTVEPKGTQGPIFVTVSPSFPIIS